VTVADLRRHHTRNRPQALTRRTLQANPRLKHRIRTDLADADREGFAGRGGEAPHVEVADVNRAGVVAAIGHRAAFVAQRSGERGRHPCQREGVIARRIPSGVVRRHQHRVRAGDGGRCFDLCRHLAGNRPQALTRRALQANPRLKHAVRAHFADPDDESIARRRRETPHVEVADVNRAGVVGPIAQPAAFVAGRNREGTRPFRQGEGVVARRIPTRVVRRHDDRVGPSDRRRRFNLGRHDTRNRAQALTRRALQANPWSEQTRRAHFADSENDVVAGRRVEAPHVEVADVNRAGVVRPVRQRAAFVAGRRDEGAGRLRQCEQIIANVVVAGIIARNKDGVRPRDRRRRLELRRVDA
jgi:hypothetical protein